MEVEKILLAIATKDIPAGIAITLIQEVIKIELDQ